MKYLATPYSDPDELVRDLRYRQAKALWTALMNQGKQVFAPVVHAHPAAVVHDLPKDFEFWRRWNIHFLRHADGLIVGTLPGWEGSTGVRAEIQFAQEAGIPIEYLTESYVDSTLAIYCVERVL